jgi:hypothetical protein
MCLRRSRASVSGLDPSNHHLHVARHSVLDNGLTSLGAPTGRKCRTCDLAASAQSASAGSSPDTRAVMAAQIVSEWTSAHAAEHVKKFKKDKQVITLEETDKKGMLIARMEDVLKHAKMIKPVLQASAPLSS